MRDFEIVYNFLEISLPDNHPYIYEYIINDHISEENIVNKILKLCDFLFMPPYDINFMINVIEYFLNNKKTQYLLGEIKINPIY
jgi:hypothetical protein